MRLGVVIIAGVLLMTISPPSGAQVAPYELWVGNQTTDEVLVYDGRTLSLITSILVDTDNTPTTSAPHLITFTPDQRYALVTNVRAAANRNNVVVIDAEAKRVVTSIPAGPQAHQAMPTPDGRRIWIANVAANDLAGGDRPGAHVHTGEAVPVGRDPSNHAGFTKDGRKAYLTNGGSAAGSGSIVVLDVTSGTVLKKWDDLGLEPVFTASSADGTRVYADIGFSTANPPTKNNMLFVFDPATDQVRHQVQLPFKDLHWMGEAPGAAELWISARQVNQVIVVETASGRYQVVTAITVLDKPDGMAFSPDGSRIFVAHRGQAVTGDPFALTGTQPGFSVINTATRKVLGHIPLDGDYPRSGRTSALRA